MLARPEKGRDEIEHGCLHTTPRFGRKYGSYSHGGKRVLATLRSIEDYTN
jgi:hypothetical protein